MYVWIRIDDVYIRLLYVFIYINTTIIYVYLNICVYTYNYIYSDKELLVSEFTHTNDAYTRISMYQSNVHIRILKYTCIYV